MSFSSLSFNISSLKNLVNNNQKEMKSYIDEKIDEQTKCLINIINERMEAIVNLLIIQDERINKLDQKIDRMMKNYFISHPND